MSKRCALTKLGDVVEKVRSKNAGPFWLTIDIFCGSAEAFDRVAQGVSTERVAQLFHADAKTLKRFEIPSLNVVKISLPRLLRIGTCMARPLRRLSPK
jgi:hypothetical protein